jgi:hypothetical protein
VARYTKHMQLFLDPADFLLVKEAAGREQISASGYIRRAMVRALRRDGFVQHRSKRKEAEVAAA